MLTNTLHFQQATDFLASLDADWAQLIQTVGECQFEPKPTREPYEALIRAVAILVFHIRSNYQ